MYTAWHTDLNFKRLVLDYRVIFTFLAVLIGALLWKFWRITRLYADFPTTHFLLKIFFDILENRKRDIPMSASLFQTLVSICERYQKEGIFVEWCLQPLVCVFGEESAKTFSNDPAAVDKSYKYDIVKDGLGTGLVTSNGETWKKHRKMLNPVFHVGMLKGKMAIFNENSEILVKALRESMNKPSIDVLEIIKPCSMRIVLQFTTGLKIDDIVNNCEVSKFLHAVNKLGLIMTIRFCNPLLHWKFMLNFVPSGRQYIKMYDDTRSFVKKVVAEIKNTVLSTELSRDGGEENLETEEMAHKSFAHILLDLHMKDPSFTIYDMESEVATFIAAGYDTISVSMMWCLYLLGLDHDVQDRVYAELEFIAEGPVQYEDIQQLKYMECVLKETLRLFPPIPLHGRRINKDIQCGKYKVPKGTDIVFFPYMLHRNPDIYPDPEKFNPDRFSEGNLGKKPWMHTPFSEGLRNCIGKRFAMLEMKVMLVHVLRNFRITSLDKRENIVLCWESVLVPSKPLRIQLTPRK